MDKRTDQRMRAYLLRRLKDEERDSFEARLLEEPGLLKELKALEQKFLAGHDPWRNWLCYGIGFFVGVPVGAALARILS